MRELDAQRAICGAGRVVSRWLTVLVETKTGERSVITLPNRPHLIHEPDGRIVRATRTETAHAATTR